MPSSDHWPLHARQWHLVGPPLRPDAADVAIVEREAHALHAARPAASLRALLLGVTPEIAAMRWPAGTALCAVDRCEGMIAVVWPGAAAPEGATVVQADWRALPIADASVDLVVADGCYSIFAFPGEYHALSGELARVLAPGGRLVLRAFAAPPVPESIAAIAADLHAARIGNFHVFKWRLLMALQPSPAVGVDLAEAWRAWRELVPDPAALTAKLGWPRDVVATIDAYRDAPARYTFPTLPELRATLAPRFRELACVVPSYELGERCPTLTLTPV